MADNLIILILVSVIVLPFWRNFLFNNTMKVTKVSDQILHLRAVPFEIHAGYVVTCLYLNTISTFYDNLFQFAVHILWFWENVLYINSFEFTTWFRLLFFGMADRSSGGFDDYILQVKKMKLRRVIPTKSEALCCPWRQQQHRKLQQQIFPYASAVWWSITHV